MLEHAIDVGRGGVYLQLTPAQYAKLRLLVHIKARQRRCTLDTAAQSMMC